jgi:hypothetical protein
MKTPGNKKKGGVNIFIKKKQLICLSSSGSAHFHVSWLSDFIFYQKPLYKSLHQSFFYSFITILPSESGVTLHYSTIIWMLFTYANNAQIIWCAELSSSHHAMRYCYHSVLRSYYSAIWLPFPNIQMWSRDTNWMITVTHCMMGTT